MSVNDSFYRRKLPHWQVNGAAHFMTWRLEGALTIRMPPNLAWIDELADTTGPDWLKQPRIAELVVSALHSGQEQLKLYELLAWVVMSNHVHVVINPTVPLAQITKSIKCYTAREANKILGLTGQFWQHESFDHWIRDRHELAEVIRYVEQNPVKAGLVGCEADWRWSSAFMRTQACGL